MTDRINLSVITSAGTVFDKTVSYVNIPTCFGSVGVLSGHAPMMCAVVKGIVRCSFGDGAAVKIAVGDGVADVAHNQVTLLVSRARVMTE